MLNLRVSKIMGNPGEKCLGDGDMINMEDGVTSNVINMIVEEPMATVLS